MGKRRFFLPWAKQNDESGVVDFVSAKSHCIDFQQNKNVYELSSISYQAHFGLENSTIANTIAKQAKSYYALPTKTESLLKTKATDELINYLDHNEEGRIFYTLSGSESIENALKMARNFTQKKIILARQSSYHGASLGALSVTGDWRNAPHYTIDEWTVRIPEPEDDPELKKTRELIKKIGSENICGFCLETVTGGNGVLIPAHSWWRGIQELCKEFDLKLILDEVICAFERLGYSLGLKHYQIQPDFICLAKGITAGSFPLGAVWVKESLASYYDDRPLVQGLTNYAHPLGLAAMRVNLTLLKKMRKKLDELNNVFSDEIKKIEDHPQVLATRKIGLLAAIDLKSTYTYKHFIKHGLQLIIKNEKMITLAPAYTYTPGELRKAFERLGRALGDTNE